MENKPYLKKEFIKFEKPFDFNSLALMLGENNFSTKVTSNHNSNYILDGVIQIKDVHGDTKFHPLAKVLNDQFNKENNYFDLDMFFSTSIGASSITHKDPYNVYILGVCGHTIYKINEESFDICPGDLLFIPENFLHTAIGMTPRIILSYARHLEKPAQITTQTPRAKQ